MEAKNLPPVVNVRSVLMGEVIAERRFTLLTDTGDKREVCVQLAGPEMADIAGEPAGYPQMFRCTLRITGLDLDEKVFPAQGEDPFVALQYAIDFAGNLLDAALTRLSLTNPVAVHWEGKGRDKLHFDPAERASWIWRYDSRR